MRCILMPSFNHLFRQSNEILLGRFSLPMSLQRVSSQTYRRRNIDIAIQHHLWPPNKFLASRRVALLIGRTYYLIKRYFTVNYFIKLLSRIAFPRVIPGVASHKAVFQL